MTSAKVCENCLSGVKPCLGHPCALAAPTPDPRERDVCAWCDARVIHSPKCPDYPEDAPAPSEADGALNYLRECVDAMREGRDGDGVFSQKAYELLDELATHPAPARGVTEEEREVMGDIALDGFIDWCDLDPTDENRSASALARQYLALRQKSRTPDAEGGA